MLTRPAVPCIAALAAALALASCGLPEDADVAPSDYVQASPPPVLLPDAVFAQAAAGAGPARIRIETEAAALEARAEALRAGAEALAAPVVDPDTRARLEASAAR